MTVDGGRGEHPIEPAEGDREAGEQAEERVRRQQEEQQQTDPDDESARDSGS